MTTETVQTGQAADGYGIVLWVPTIADPTAPTATELAAGTVKRITYGLAPDGFRHDTTVSTINTGRYTLKQTIELDGTVTDTVEIQYVYNRETPTVVETALGTPGTAGYIVHALGYESGHTFAEDDVLNAVIPVSTSIARDVPPTANTELMKVLKLNVTGTVHREVAVAAGA
jgi:hypothetical protein